MINHRVIDEPPRPRNFLHESICAFVSCFHIRNTCLMSSMNRESDAIRARYLEDEFMCPYGVNKLGVFRTIKIDDFDRVYEVNINLDK